MGIPADGSRVRITTLTPVTPREEKEELEERLRYPCGTAKHETDKKPQESHKTPYL